MDQNQAPILDALAAIERRPLHGFGAPAHHQGAAIPSGLRRLLGRKVFRADVLTPKGLDDRTEGGLVLQRAHEIAAEAWGVDFCRFVTGGSTQSLHSVLAALVAPGETVLLATNAHKAEHAYALAAGLDAVPLPVEIDEAWDIERGVGAATLTAALDANPRTRAVVVVSPNYYGVTCDIAALSAITRARGVPLVVDAAWGAAFAFSPRLPADAVAAGADVQVCSLHKTLGALAQGSVILARAGGVVDLQRLWMAYELFETTSVSVPILASMDATRRDHATGGAGIWDKVLDRAARARRDLAAIPGVRVLGRDDLRPGEDIDESKILLDVSASGAAGYAIDDWLFAHHRVSVGLADARHLLVVLSPGTSARAVRALVAALRDCLTRLAADPTMLPAAPELPGIATLGFERAMPGPAAFFAAAQAVPFERAAGRIAAEIIAPSPPGVPRLVPGQVISPAHVAFLVAHGEAGAFVLDPIDPAGATVRVVEE